MPNEHNQGVPRIRRMRSTASRNDLANWRRLTRPLILDDFLDRTRDLPWSRELIDLLPDELHVSDEFDDLIGRVLSSAQVNYPQLVALAWSFDTAASPRTSPESSRSPGSRSHLPQLRSIAVPPLTSSTSPIAAASRATRLHRHTSAHVRKENNGLADHSFATGRGSTTSHSRAHLRLSTVPRQRRPCRRHCDARLEHATDRQLVKVAC
jgi:hypothetical protein